jgi:hypothetical protein
MVENTTPKVAEPVRPDRDRATTERRLEAARRVLLAAAAPADAAAPTISRWSSWYNR